MTVPLANSLLPEYINLKGKNLCQKQVVQKKSVSDNCQVTKICRAY